MTSSKPIQKSAFFVQSKPRKEDDFRQSQFKNWRSLCKANQEKKMTSSKPIQKSAFFVQSKPRKEDDFVKSQIQKNCFVESQIGFGLDQVK